jgi:hypothetical protein
VLGPVNARCHFRIGRYFKTARVALLFPVQYASPSERGKPPPPIPPPRGDGITPPMEKASPGNSQGLRQDVMHSANNVWPGGQGPIAQLNRACRRDRVCCLALANGHKGTKQASVLACRSRSRCNMRADNNSLFLAQVMNPQAFVNAC